MAPNSPDDPLDAELLARFLAGECSEAEAALVRRALMARPEEARALDGFLAGLDGECERPPLTDGASSWARLQERMRAEDAARGASPGGAPRAAHRPHFVLHRSAPSPFRRTAVWVGGAVAATLAVVALRVTRAPHAAPAESRTFTTAVGQRAELRLTDGTRVLMAPDSRLRVAGDFGDARRDVTLEGEAFFEVAHDSTHPFTVYAGNASAHDIGTAFAVRSYSTDGAVQIVVREGAVAMSGVGRLSAGDVGVLTNEGKTAVRRKADVAAMLGWLDGTLSYRDAPLARVLDDLHRWQGTEVALRDSALATLPFTGEMNGLSARSAVGLVAATLGLRLTRDGERYLLAPIAGRTPGPSRFNPGRRPHAQ